MFYSMHISAYGKLKTLSLTYVDVYFPTAMWSIKLHTTAGIVMSNTKCVFFMNWIYDIKTCSIKIQNRTLHFLSSSTSKLIHSLLLKKKGRKRKAAFLLLYQQGQCVLCQTLKPRQLAVGRNKR